MRKAYNLRRRFVLVHRGGVAQAPVHFVYSLPDLRASLPTPVNREAALMVSNYRQKFQFNYLWHMNNDF